jgi:aminotransferase
LEQTICLVTPLPRAVVDSFDLPPFDPLNRRAAELRTQGHQVISLGQAVPFFGPPAEALAAGRAALETPDVHRYVTDQGLPALRRALGERLGVTGHELVITAGANHAFALVHATVVNPGDEVILPGPYFTNHWMMSAFLGATPVEAPVADRETFSVRWTDIEPHVTTRTRAIVLCNPSNPTGAPIEAAEGERILSEAASRGLIVISDETYRQFVYEGEHWSASAKASARSAIVIGTFSKSFGMMGWRVGFVLADAATCEQAVKVQDSMIICAPVMSQVMAEAAVRTSWDYPRSFWDELRERRQVLADGLARIPGVHWTPTRAGMFAFARIDGCSDSTRLSHELLERAHVVTIPGAVFGTSGEGYLRISYGFATQAEIREACERMHEYVVGGR